MWRQKAKALWAKKGDNTSKLFHRTVNGRQSRSLINKIESREGIILEDMRSAEKEIADYFKKFCIPLKEFQGLEFMAFIEVLFLLARLERLFEVEEVRSAVDQCSAKKSPGPDGDFCSTGVINS